MDLDLLLGGVTDDMLTMTKGFETMDPMFLGHFVKHYRANVKEIIPNCILVLHGGRLAYRMDVAIFNDKLYNYLYNVIPKAFPGLTIVECADMEPFICLESKASEVEAIMQSSTEYDMSMGHILGYEYVCNPCLISNKCIVSYIAHNTLDIYLYSYSLPQDQLTDDIKARIENTTKGFNDILSQYGYTTRYEIKSMSDLMAS